MTTKEDDKVSYLNCISIYGAKTRKSLVQVTYENHSFILDPDEARDHGLNLLAVAEASEHDAFLFEFIKNELNQTDQVAAELMSSFREFRAEKDRQATYKRKESVLIKKKEE